PLSPRLFAPDTPPLDAAQRALCAPDPVVSPPSVDPSRDAPATPRPPHIVVATSDVQSHAATAPRAGVSSRWPATTSKTRARARGLARRQVGLVPVCGSAQPPAALAVSGDLIRSHADPRLARECDRQRARAANRRMP